MLTKYHPKPQHTHAVPKLSTKQIENYVRQTLHFNLKNLNQDLEDHQIEVLTRPYIEEMEKPFRHFHNLSNVAKELSLANQFRKRKDYHIIVAAILFKDFSYQPLNPDNRMRSAAYASGLYPERISAQVEKYILSARNKFLFKSFRDGRDAVSDIDLGIFGSTRKEFVTGFENIRWEFEERIHPADVEILFRESFARLLMHSRKGGVYRTPQFKRFEPQLSTNIRLLLNNWR